MTQRFYLCTPLPHERELCNAGGCEFVSSWFDVFFQAWWCDFHALAVQGGAVYSMCGGCLEWYPSSQLTDGFCCVCRSAGSVRWSDVPEHEIQRPDDDLYGFPCDVDQVDLG